MRVEVVSYNVKERAEVRNTNLLKRTDRLGEAAAAAAEVDESDDDDDVDDDDDEEG